MHTYHYFNGIKELSRKLSGKENICLAIRPYGFHAGNQLPFTIYPELLCQELEKKGKSAQFTFFVVFNDWEQLKLFGPDVKRFPFNVLPIDTTLQYTKDPDGKEASIVDCWAPFILENVKKSLKDFPLVTIKAIRYSEFKNDKRLIQVLEKTLKDPQVFIEILKKYSTKEVLNYPTEYVIAVCPYCHQTIGKTTYLKKNYIQHFCSKCFKIYTGEIKHFDYWFYHTPLALPRYQILDIDLCITGADKIDESDYLVRQKLAEAYGINLKMPDVLYSPLVTDKKGDRMGKSRGNHIYVNPKILKKMILNDLNTEKVIVDFSTIQPIQQMIS